MVATTVAKAASYAAEPWKSLLTPGQRLGIPVVPGMLPSSHNIFDGRPMHSPILSCLVIMILAFAFKVE